MKFQPVLFVGLGAEGSSLASVAMQEALRRNAGRERLIRGISIADDLSMGDLAAAASAVKASSPADGYASVFQRAMSAQESVASFIAEAVGELRGHEIWLDLAEDGVELDDTVLAAIFTPLFGPGSALLVPLLSFLHDLLRSRQLARLDIQLFGFFPDLFEPVRRDPAAYARAYVCLQEVDWIVEHHLAETNAFKMAYLFTLRNEARIEMSSPAVLAETIGAVIDLLVKGEIAGDQSFEHALLKPVEGQKARYSSFGFSTLVLPVDEMMTALTGEFASEVLTKAGFLSTETFDRHRAGLDVTKFFRDAKFDQPESQIRRGADGREIWSDFTYTQAANERVLADHFIEAIAKEGVAFERGPLAEMLRKVHDRTDVAIDLQREKIREVVHQRIDSEGVQYARAFLDALQNRNSDLLSGEFIGDILTLDDIDARARTFFDKELGIDRARFGRLRSDLDSKRAARKQNAAELEKKEAESVDENDRDATGAIDRKAQIKALQERVAIAKDEEHQLVEQYTETAQKIREHDLALTDGTRRRRLLEDIRSGEVEERARGEQHVRETDVSLRDARAHFDAVCADGRAQIYRRVVTLGLGVAGAALLAYVIRGYVPATITGYWSKAWKTIGAGAALYILRGLWVYFTVIKPAYDAALRQVQRRVMDKKNAQHALETIYRDGFRKVFDFTVHGLLVDWAVALRKAVATTAEQLKDFVTAAAQHAAEGSERFRSVEFESSNSMRYITSGDQVRTLPVATQRFADVVRAFFAGKPRSAYFSDFATTGAMHLLRDDLTAKAEDVFRDVRQASVESTLAKQGNARLLRDRAKHLISFASPFIELGVEPGRDESAVLRYLGTTLPGSSCVVAELAEAAVQSTPYQNSDPTRAVMTTLKVGFPAFHIAALHQAQHAALGRDAAQFRLDPDWPLRPLFPSVYSMGSEADDARRVACQAVALGLVQQVTNGDFVVDGMPFGDSYWAFVEKLRGLAGAAAKVRLEVKIREARSRPDAAERILEKLSDAHIDEIDRRILQDLLDEIESS